jgi:hypothetical protein
MVFAGRRALRVFYRSIVFVVFVDRRALRVLCRSGRSFGDVVDRLLLTPACNDTHPLDGVDRRR